MKNLLLATLLTLIASAPVWAYPPQHSPSAAPIYRDPGKGSTFLYDQPQTYSLPTYSQEQNSIRTLTPYKADQSGTLTDFNERNPRDREFEMYNKIQDKYEKKPRFSF